MPRLPRGKARMGGGPQSRIAQAKIAAMIPPIPPWNTKCGHKVDKPCHDGKTPYAKKIMVSRMFVLISLGCAVQTGHLGGHSALMAGQQMIIDLQATGGAHTVSFDQKKLALKSFENWVLYIMPQNHPDRLKIVEMQRILYNPQPGDPSPSEYKYPGPMGAETITAYVNMLIAPGSKETPIEQNEYVTPPLSSPLRLPYPQNPPSWSRPFFLLFMIFKIK